MLRSCASSYGQEGPAAFSRVRCLPARSNAKAWSVTTYLIKNHREQFSVFCRRCLAPWRGEKSLTQADAWKLVFKEITPEEVETKWRAWIVEQPLGPSREDKLKLLEKGG